MTVVENEVAFGLENLGTPPAQIWPRVERALESVGARHLRGRKTGRALGWGAPARLPRLGARARAGAPAPRRADLAARSRTPRSSSSTPSRASARPLCSRSTASAVRWRSRRACSSSRAAASCSTLRSPRRSTGLPQTDLSTRARALVLLQHKLLRRRRTSSFRLRDVTFAYRGGPPVLAEVDLELRRGEIVCLAGPNGSGKTTLAKLAAGLLEPDAGTVERRGRVFYLSQDPGRYLVRETALDEVSLAVAGDSTRARTALERVGLSWAAGRHPRDLSSGERERLALAAVEVGQPDLLVLDEPTRGMDPERKQELGRGSSSYAAAGRAVLVATHDTGLPAHRRIELSVETTQAPVGAEEDPACRLGSSRSAPPPRSPSRPGRRSIPTAAASPCSLRRSPSSRPGSPGSRAGRWRHGT